MRGDELLDILEHIDSDLIESADRKRKSNWLRRTAVAACAVLLLGFACLPRRPANSPVPTVATTTESPTSPSPPELLPNQLPLADYTQSPEKLTGIRVLGNPAYAPGLPQSSPPAFSFDINMVVEARVIEILPDLYTDLQTNRQYHLLRMQTLGAVNVPDMPDEFLLRIYSYLSPELDRFDSLILSLEQVGGQNYPLINETNSTVESFPNMFQVYCHYAPHYGSVMAFTGGILDTSLWEMDGWTVSASYLDGILSDSNGHYPASKRSSPEDVKEAVWQSLNNCECRPWRIICDFETIDYVTPFQNGVFAHSTPGDATIFTWYSYTRYINGFSTSEKILVKGTGDISYEGEAFTQEELSKMPDLSALLAKLDLDTMTPPHTTVQEDFTLHNCGAEGQYMKVDGTVYGIVKVSWYYLQPIENYSVGYYDALFYLVQADGTYREATRTELEAALGRDLFESDPKYGVGMELPLC